MKNKVLAMLLALCMVMSLLPVSVFAVGDEDTCECGCAYADCDACTAAEGDPDDGGTAASCGCIEDGEPVDDCCECEACENNADDGSDEDDPREEPCSLSACKLEAGHRGDHVVDCICRGEDDGCTSVSHGDDGCAYVVYVPQGETAEAAAAEAVCDPCRKSIEVNEATAEPVEDEPVSCTPAGDDGTAAIAGNDGCTSKEHENDCPKKCDVGNCTLTKGDHTTHNNTTCLGGKPGCNPKATHDVACDEYDLTPDAGKGKDKDYIVVEWVAACACETENHATAHTDCAGDPAEDGTGVKLSVKYYFEYEWDLIDKNEVPLTAEQAAAAQALALRDAKIAAEAKAKGTADENGDYPYTAAAALLDEGDDICAACKAADDEEETLDPEVVEAQLKLCTSAYDCPAGQNVEGGNKAAYHHDDCLSLCTMGTGCENTEGDSSAHRTQYWVYRATYKDTFRPGTESVIKTVRTQAPTAVGIGFETLGEAQAYRASLPEADEKADNQQVWYAYSIRAIHCPMAKVPDGVVVNEEGEVLETPEVVEPETKAPEKATDFEDVKEGAWYIPELDALMAKGIVKGSVDGGVYRFKAADKMTTDYLVVFLSRVLNKGLKTEGTGWADEANAWAKEEGLLDGIEAGEIDRKDVVLVLWRAMGKTEAEQDLSKFEDAAGLEGDHLAAMQWAVSAGVVKGDGDTGTLKTDDVITRAEMIAMLARLDVSEK